MALTTEQLYENLDDFGSKIGHCVLLTAYLALVDASWQEQNELEKTLDGLQQEFLKLEMQWQMSLDEEFSPQEIEELFSELE